MTTPAPHQVRTPSAGAPNGLTRRNLLALGGAWSLIWLGLDRRLSAEEPTANPGLPNFGPLVADPKGMLDLPEGFRYVVVSQAGATMADGHIAPSAMDGMAAFAGAGGTILLVRNHELTPGDASRGPFAKGTTPPAGKLYDAGKGKNPSQGGTTTVVVDPTSGAMIHEYLSLAGTNRNCAGGPTPWGSWITCEEDMTEPGTNNKGWEAEQLHGYAFDVPARNEIGLVDPVPLLAMGRFRREAIAVDPATGIIYQTEDSRDGVFYRFIPTEPGKPAAGGRLQALRLPDLKADNTRNWDDHTVAVGASHACAWVDIADPSNNTAQQAIKQGCQRFTRGEGCWHGAGAVWFACTDGGKNRKGQIWQYVPGPTPDDGGTLTLFVEPDDGAVLENVDNLTVTPWDGLFACEDNASKDASPENRLVHIRPDGVAEIFAVNRLNTGELAGACFSPDGKWCFLNIMYPGVTVAITGPWPS